MVAAADTAERAEGLSLRSRFSRFGNVGVLELAPGDTVAAAVARLRATGRYEYVEPDYIRRATVAAVVPDDPQFANQWALSNTGTNAGGGGLPGADIHAEEGWETRTGAPGIIVGMIDSGAMLTHEDLKANLWVNPSPGTTATYGDGAGSSSETDSLNGLNAVAMSGDPADDLGHGSHTSGIVGAVGNNALGVSGVAWQVQLMELKFIGSNDQGSTSDELPCIEYAIAHHVSVINASFGDTMYSQAEMNAIYAAGQAGVIFVCSAGNSSENVDVSPFFPADYPLDNIICVGASDNRDLPVYFSNYGSGSVEIFAPGENIVSTYFSSATSYAYLSGTSMSAPFVTGTVALLRAQYPSDTYRETINRVLNSADTNPGLAGKAQTGGRLNLARALAAPNTAPNALFAGRTVLVGLDPYTRSNNVDTPLALEAGTPALAAGAGHSQWWQWTAPEDATVEIDTSGTLGGAIPGGSSYPTALGVYTGSALSSLVAVASNTGFGTEPPAGGGANVPYSEVTFHAAAGTTYQVNVQGLNGASGQTILAINTTPDNDSISSPRVLAGPSVSVLGANVNATLQSGEPRIMGNAGGHSLWYSWTAPSSGTFQVSGYSYDFVPAVAVYTGTSFASLAAVASASGSAAAGTTTLASECLCTLSAAAGTTYLIAIDGVTQDDIGDFTLTIDDSAWQAATGDAVTCSPAVGPDGTVYVGSNDNTLYAFGPTGALKWSHAEGAEFDTSTAVIGPDGTIYCGSLAGLLHALGPDGSVKWTYTVPGAAGTSASGNTITASPALGADGTVYVHSSDGNLYAVNPDGSLKWKAAVPGGSYAAATLAPDGTIYIGTDGGSLYALNPSGTQKWVFTTPVQGEPIYTSAAIDAAGNLYFGTLTGNFYSVGPSGSLRWSHAVGDGVTSAPALANGSVYFGGYDSNLYSLSMASGALQWAFPLGAQVRASAPAVDANGTVYVGCYDHFVYAVSAAGSLVRTYASDDYIRSSPAIRGTTLYFGSDDHKVYAFNIGVGPAASDWPMYQYGADRPGRAVTYALGVVTPPASQNVAPGAPFTLTVVASGPGALAYQWSLNGAPIAGATASSYSVASASQANAGSYTVTVTSGSSSVTSAAATVTVSATPPARLTNISTRALVGTGASILIPGLYISGSGSETLLIRGDGPALTAYGVSGVLAQPTLGVFNAAGTMVASNTAWGTGADPAQVAAVSSQVGAFALAAGSADCALIVTLPAGAYTVQISGVGGTTGVALAEVYEVSATGTARLADISTRAMVGTGANIIIPGFYISGSGSEQLLVRADGPSLTQFGVSGVLAQPTLGLYNAAGALVASNTGWGSAADPAQIASDAASAGAFAFASGSADSALVVTLPAGAYTMQVSGVASTTGVALAEIYEVP